MSWLQREKVSNLGFGDQRDKMLVGQKTQDSILQGSVVHKQYTRTGTNGPFLPSDRAKT